VRDLFPQLEQAPTAPADRLFLDHVQHDVLDPAGAHSATCAEPPAPMLYYPPLTDPTSAGQVPPTGPAACASGGWFLTPADLLRVLGGLEHGQLLTAGQKRQMDDGCLGWDACTPAGSHWKTGAFGDHNGAAFHTYFGTLAGASLVVVTNSPAPNRLDTIAAQALPAAHIPSNDRKDDIMMVEKWMRLRDYRDYRE
jgi:hypothetical protein